MFATHSTPWRPVALITILLLIAPISLLAEDSTVAIISPPGQPETQTVTALAEVELAHRSIALVDRQSIAKILQEQKLVMSGIANQSLAIQLGKLSGASLFTFIEGDPITKKPTGCVVYESRTGLRLVDECLESASTPELVKEIVACVEAAIAKSRKRGNSLKVMTIVATRAVDLSPAQRTVCEALGRIVESELVRADSIAVVERRRLAVRGQEAALGIPTVVPEALIVADFQIELQFQEETNRRGYTAIATVKTPEGRTIEQLTASTKSLEAGISKELATKIAIVLNISPAPPERLTRRERESNRFFREAQIRASNQDFAEAVAAAESALALDPESFEIRQLLCTLLCQHAMKIIQAERSSSKQTPLPNLEALEQPLSNTGRALDVIGNVVVGLEGTLPVELLSPQISKVSSCFGELSQCLYQLEIVKLQQPAEQAQLKEQLKERYSLCRQHFWRVIESPKLHHERVWSNLLGLAHRAMDWRLARFEDSATRTRDAFRLAEFLRARFEDREVQLRQELTFNRWELNSFLMRFTNMKATSDWDRSIADPIYHQWVASANPCFQAHGRVGLLGTAVANISDQQQRTEQYRQGFIPLLQNIYKQIPQQPKTPSDHYLRQECYRFIYGSLGRESQFALGDSWISEYLRLAKHQRQHRVVDLGLMDDLYSRAKSTRSADERSLIHRLLQEAVGDLKSDSFAVLYSLSRENGIQRIELNLRELQAASPELLTSQTPIQGNPPVPDSEVVMLTPFYAAAPGWSIWNFTRQDNHLYLLLVDQGAREPTGIQHQLEFVRIDTATGQSQTLARTKSTFPPAADNFAKRLFVRQRQMFSSPKAWYHSLGGTIWKLHLPQGPLEELSLRVDLPESFTPQCTDGEFAYIGTSDGNLISVSLADGTKRALISSQRVEALTPLDNREAFRFASLAYDEPRRRLLFTLDTKRADSDTSGLWEYDLKNQQARRILEPEGPSPSFQIRKLDGHRLTLSTFGNFTIWSMDSGKATGVGNSPLRHDFGSFSRMQLLNEAYFRGVLLDSGLWWPAVGESSLWFCEDLIVPPRKIAYRFPDRAKPGDNQGLSLLDLDSQRLYLANPAAIFTGNLVRPSTAQNNELKATFLIVPFQLQGLYPPDLLIPKLKDRGISLVPPLQLQSLINDRVIDLSGRVDGTLARQIGQHTRADLAVFMNFPTFYGGNPHAKLGEFVIYEAKTGVRLVSSPIPYQPNQNVQVLIRSLDEAKAKFLEPSATRKVLALRRCERVGLPESDELASQTLALLIEREISRGSPFVILERPRHRWVGESVSNPLSTEARTVRDASNVWIDLKFEQRSENPPIRISGTISYRDEAKSALVESTGDRLGAQLAMEFAQKLRQALGMPAVEQPPQDSLQREFAYFSGESWNGINQRKYREARIAAESAFILDPIDPLSRLILAECLAEDAGQTLAGALKSNGDAPAIEAALDLSRRAIEHVELWIAEVEQDKRRAELAQIVTILGQIHNALARRVIAPLNERLNTPSGQDLRSLKTSIDRQAHAIIKNIDRILELEYRQSATMSISFEGLAISAIRDSVVLDGYLSNPTNYRLSICDRYVQRAEQQLARDPNAKHNNPWRLHSLLSTQTSLEACKRVDPVAAAPVFTKWSQGSNSCVRLHGRKGLAGLACQKRPSKEVDFAKYEQQLAPLFEDAIVELEKSRDLPPGGQALEAYARRPLIAFLLELDEHREPWADLDRYVKLLEVMVKNSHLDIDRLVTFGRQSLKSDGNPHAPRIYKLLLDCVQFLETDRYRVDLLGQRYTPDSAAKEVRVVLKEMEAKFPDLSPKTINRLLPTR